MNFLRSTRGKVIAAIAGGVALVAFIWLIVWLSVNDLWPVARDVSLVFLAVFTLVPLVALTYAVLELARTTKALKRELTPMISELRETTQTMRDTAKAANDLTVKPAIRTASFVVGFTQAASIILGKGTASRRRAERQRRAAKAATEEAGHDAG